MPPTVTDIVTVDHGVAFGLEQLDKLRFALVNQVEFIKLVVLRDGPILPILLELVKVAVGPTHDDLEYVVQAAQRDRTRNLNSSPDWWFDVHERDLQLVERRRCLLGGHTDILQCLGELLLRCSKASLLV